MNNTLKIAFRNLSRQKKRVFLLGGAITFGIMIITLLNGFTGGITENVKENFSSIFGGHIFISGSEVTESGRVITVIRDESVIKKAIEPVSGYIRSVHKRSKVMAELIFGSKSCIQRIDGLDWGEEGFLESLPIVEGSVTSLSSSSGSSGVKGDEGLNIKKQAIILPVSTAKRLGIEVGESLIARLSTVTGQKNVGDFVLVATVKDQETFGISNAYAHIDYLNELLGLSDNEFQTLNIYLKNMDDIDWVANEIYERIKSLALVDSRLDGGSPMTSKEGEPSGSKRKAMASLIGGSMLSTSVTELWKGTKYSVITLNDMLSSVKDMVRVLNTVGFGIFIILLVITMVGITNSFRMTVRERTREIGTMRAIGMQRTGVRNILLTEAFFIALLGAIVGILLAFVAMLILGRIPIGSSFMWIFLHNGKVTFNVIFRDIVINLVVLIILSMVAAWGPAKRASKLTPAEALRTEF